MSNSNGMDRRGFLKNSALGAGALGLGAIGGGNLLHAEQKEDAPFKIKEYRTLGRTGFKVSDISTGYVKDPVVLERLLDAGVNYIDTAESYGNEPVVGDVIKKRGNRKKVFITTKLEVKKDNVTKEHFLKRARKCLERLKTDYIDCMMMHSCEEVKTIHTEGFHAAMKQLKAEGRLRHVGISNHGSSYPGEIKDSMEKVLTTAAMDGRFDVMLLVYNFMQEQNGAKVLKLLHEKNIGATLMKVNPLGSLPRIKERIAKLKEEGKEIPEFYPKALTHLEAAAKRAAGYLEKHKLDNAKKMRDAAIRFTLANPHVSSVCCGFRNFDSLDQFLPLSGTKPTKAEAIALAAYKDGCSELYCRHACGLCQGSCPNNVPINTIMRYNHYYDAQGKEKFAMKKYALLDTPKADTCASCSGHCQAACPYGVAVHGMLHLAHRNLTLV